MDVVVSAAERSPFAAADGVLAGWHPVDLAATVLDALTTTAGVDPATVDEVWVGCAEPVGAQGADLARAIVLAAGWPDTVGGSVVDRAETSGSAALHAAAATILAGTGRRVVVLGVSSASSVPPGASALGRTYGRPWGDAPAARYESEGGLLPSPRVAEHHALGLGLGRAIQDEVTAASHRLRRAATAPAGLVTVGAKPAETVAMARDTPVTDDVLRAAPADPGELTPMFDENGTVTGASFACPADGVAGLLLEAEPTGRATAVLRGWSRSAGDPFDATGGAGRAIETALGHAGVDRTRVDRWEIVESTAASFLCVAAAIDDPAAAINPDGGTLAIGDAGAAEELRLPVDAITRADPGAIVVTVAAGPTGSAASVWECGS